MGKLVLLRGPNARERFEEEQEAVIENLSRVRAEIAPVEEDLVHDRLVVTAGAKKGQPLGPKGRKRPLGKLRFLWSEEHKLLETRHALE